MADIQKLIGSESPLEVGQKINEIIDNKANPDLSNLSSTGQAKLDEKADRSEVDKKVNKSGDTMTGNLTIAGSQKMSVIKSTDLDYTTKPSTANISAFRNTDKNNKFLGDVRFERTTDGVQWTRILARNCMTGSEVSATIGIAVGADGKGYTYAPTPSTGDNSTKIATTAFCKNMATTTKATTTSSASATRPAWIIQNYVNGHSWYRVWSDGWIEQGGLVNGGNNSDAVTLLKSYTNANYSVMTSLKHTATQAAYAIIVSNVSATGFTLFTYSGGAKECSKCWYAYGY